MGDSRQARRERYQLLAIWALGAATLAVPALHAVDHHGDHIHVGGATIPLATLDIADSSDSGTAPGSTAPGHGSGSLAHLSLGWLDAPVFVVPAAIAVVVAVLTAALPPAPSLALRRTCSARAPPIV